MSAPRLEIDTVTVRFGGLTCLSEVSLAVADGELAGLIGPNGAGKTTLFNLVTAVYRPTSGGIRLAGESTAAWEPQQLAARGVARTFQNIRLFPSLSVLDNVRVAAQLHNTHGAAQAWWHGAGFRTRETAVERELLELLELFDLARFRDEPAKSLPYGDQRRLEIVRALATRPRLLLLDEPAAGMNPTEKTALAGLIRKIRDRFGLAILLVEHDMPLVMELCERIHVLDHGVKIAAGTPAQIRRHPQVIEAYLGAESAANLRDS